ncbi:uncharacterized protein LOC120357299 [Solenopsis invicta]|uniref:uncharacterized protein LOC120357299 n=1 Tax=Solenopsis invicta TaxID=13686 RepID=UPI00193E9F2F|nr:uncharacterized protein LOC120357299 [Solenopsis invicta]
MPVDRTPVKSESTPSTSTTSTSASILSLQQEVGMEILNLPSGIEHQSSGESTQIHPNEFRLLKLPTFWYKQPKLWFAQIESEFTVYRIRSEDIKYSSVIRHLDEQALIAISEIVENPPEIDKYNQLKKALIHRFTDSEEKRLRQLLADNILHSIWLQRLPYRVQATLAVVENVPLVKLSELADKIVERDTGFQVAEVNTSTSKQSDFSDLERRIAALEVSRRYGRSFSRSRRKLEAPLKIEAAYNGLPCHRLVIFDKSSNLHFLVETGADISLVPKRVLFKPLSTNFKLFAANGADFLGHFNLLVDIKNKRLIDSVTGLKHFGKIQEVLELSICTTSPDSPYHRILAEFPGRTRFAPLSSVKSHGIENRIITEGSPKFSVPRRLSPEKLKFAKEEIKFMMEQGICRPSSSTWAAPLHMVPKSENVLRLCGDYRALNSVNVPDRYPLPHIQDFTSGLYVKAYYQVPVAKEDIHKNAVTTPFGLFEFFVMPFGLRNAQTFQRLMNSLLSDLDFAFCYLDDILIASKNEQEHIAHLRIIFNRLLQAGMSINVSKCLFGKKNFLFSNSFKSRY